MQSYFQTMLQPRFKSLPIHNIVSWWAELQEFLSDNRHFHATGSVVKANLS